MAFFKQLRLLLKHKILLRRRQPITLCLELFWPGFVFVAILLVASQFPATFRQTCYYSAKALPSAGLVNLMQSYVCNLNNPCLDASQYQEVPKYPNASIHAIVDQVMPLLTNRNVTDVINDLPKGIRLIAAIIDTLSSTLVQNLLEDGFPLKQVLRPSGWRTLETELDRLEATVVPFSDLDLVATDDSAISSETHRNSTAVISSYDILVNSSLNLIQLGIQSDSAGSLRSIRSFRDVICDHTQLEMFLLVPKRHYIRLLSRRLCLLERKDLYHLFDLAQENIDFVAILEQLSTILRSVGLADHQQHVDNIIAMIGTIDRANIFRSVGALRNTSWMYDMPSLLGVIRSGDVDVSTLLKIVSDIEPMFSSERNGNGLAAALVADDHFEAMSAAEKLQQQQLEYLMQFYNAEDSTLRSIAADWSFPGTVQPVMLSTTTETPFDFARNQSEEDAINERFKEFKTLGDTPIDLDASESQQALTATAEQGNRQNPSFSTNIQNESLSRKFLPKLIGNMDRLIDDTERFTKTSQWESLLSAFQGLQMLLEMAADETSSESMASKNKLFSMNIETFILSLPKKLQAFNTFFNSLIPEKLQPLLYPLFNLFHRASDSMLQHLSGAFSRALAEDKIYYFDRFAQLLLSSLVNGTLPRKCVDIQQAMCHFETFQSVFIMGIDEETEQSTVLFEGDQGTLQGIQELGCLFFGHNYWQDEAESTPILAKLYYTLSTLNDTNLLASLASATAYLDPQNNSSSTTASSDSAEEDKAFWTNFTSRMLEVYLLATKSVPATTWENIWRELRSNWKTNGFSDRAIFLSRILQLSADCFIPNRIVQSSIWRAIYRKNAILHELLNVVLDEINASAESEALKVAQVAMGSPTLASFLQKHLLPVLPSLIDAAFETVLFHLPQFVERAFQLYPYFAAGWPCNRATSLLDVLTFTSSANRSAVVAIEQFLCGQVKLRPGSSGRIIDELLQPANNESARIAPLIRATQSKSLNLTLIHDNLPPLDWVEAASSLAGVKESAEKILSMDGSLVWFPEEPALNGLIGDAFTRGSDAFFRRFLSQGTFGLFAYIGDIVTPFANRYLSFNETFSTTCDMGVAGVLMAPVYNDKEWRCLFITLKYASYTINHIFDLVNDVLKNFLAITAPQEDDGKIDTQLNITSSCSLLTNPTSSNRFISLADSVPELLELALNELLLGDVERLSKTTTLNDLLCSSHLNLDALSSRSPFYADLRQAVCQLSTELSSCSNLLMPERWQQTLDYLNVTWYHRSADSALLTGGKASFADAYHNVYRFLTLFGRFSPKLLNRLVARYESLDTQQYLGAVLRRLNRLEYFRSRRFVYVMQTVGREANALLFGKFTSSSRHNQEQRDLMMALIYAFSELPGRLRQRYKLGGIHVKMSHAGNADDEEVGQVDLLDSLLDWLDSHLLVGAETFLQTITLDSGRLLKLFAHRYDTVTIWRSFCRAPLSQYVVVDNQISGGAHKAKEAVCGLDFNAVYDQWYRAAKPKLANHTDQELVAVLLVKVGAVLDHLLGDAVYRRDLLKSEEWQPILSKLGRLVMGSSSSFPSSSSSPDNNGWLIDAIASFATSLYPKASIELFQQAMARFQCGLQTIPAEGLNWEVVPTVYGGNKTEVMALYSTMNSAFTLGTVALNTFLAQDKFYKHLQMIARSTGHGKSAGKDFCALRSPHDFEEVFALTSTAVLTTSSSTEAIAVLRTLQSLVCRPNEKLLYHLNPISKCFDQPLPAESTHSFGSDLKALQDRFTALFSKNRNEVEFDDQQQQQSSSVAVPPILDLKQWNAFFRWWTAEVSPYPNSGQMLLAMRAFQLGDVFADNHVIWKAFYRLTFTFSEMFAYSLRALQLSDSMYPMKPDLQFGSLSANQQQLPLKVAKHNFNKKGLSSLLTSTVSNLIFPEVNHFITFATYRQLRWIRHISHFFAHHPDILHDELCPTLNSIHNQKLANSSSSSTPPIVIVDDDFNDLLLLLCHNHPSDWIYTLTFKSNLFNIKASPRPKFMSHRRIRERIGKLTEVLARMLDYNSSKNNKQLDHVIRFLKLKQLESIENVAGTFSILTDTILASQKVANGSGGGTDGKDNGGNSTGGVIKSSLQELVNTGWRSVPALLDAVDSYICSYKKSAESNKTDDDDDEDNIAKNFFAYRPKAPDMRVVMCEMPHWDFDRAYSYFSEHLDLKHMLQVFASPSSSSNGTSSNCKGGSSSSRCVTPLRFLSRWVDVGQDIFEQLSTSSFWSELKSCRRRHFLTLLAASKSSSNNFLLKHSLRYVRFVNGVLSTVDKFSRDSQGISWSNVRELWRTFSYFVLNQVPAYVPITDIVRHDVNLSEYLNATLDRVSTLSRSRAKQAIRLLTDSLLDINVVSWHNFSNVALKEMICKSAGGDDHRPLQGLSAAKNYLPLILAAQAKSSSVGLNMSSIGAAATQQQQQQSLYETLCQSSGLMEIIDSLMAVLDQKAISSRLRELQRTELSRGQWMSDVLLPEMSTLGSDMVASGLAAEIASKLALLGSPGGSQLSTAASPATGSSSESPSQKGINHLLISFVSFTRAKNFNTLYDSIKHAIDKLTPRFSEGPIVDSLSRILEGLRSLRGLSSRGLFHIKYQISDLLVNVENVKTFLELNMGLNKPTINQVLDASIDLSEFIEMSASISFDSSAFCNRSLLFGELKLQLPAKAGRGEPVVSEETVTSALCTLSVTEDFKFNNQILNQLVIRKLTSNIVNLIMNGLLKKATIENSEIGSALNAVRASSKAMPHVKAFIREMSRSLEGFHSDSSLGRVFNLSSMSGLKNISLAQSSELIGQVMCGGSLPALSLQMKMLKVKVQQPKINQAELFSFSSEFCRNGYRQIMAMQGGAVIWNFLKPILLGKILYTPKTAVTEAIMANMNGTLHFMPRIVAMLHAWSQTLASLESFYYQSADVNNRMTTVKHLVESVFVNGEADGLFDDVDTFNLIERMTRSGNVLAALKLIGQVAQCASFDRFQGVDSELELEEVARNLTRSHEFIAGIVFVGDKGQLSRRETLPRNIQYKIRIDIDFVPSTKALKARIWEPGPRDSEADDMGYLHGFVQIQELVDRSIVAYLTNRTTLPIRPEVHLQQQPYLCYDIDKFGNYIRSLAPLITTMAWIFLIAHLIREHVLERELHLEEVMRVMGLKSGVAWLTWFLIGITVMAFATLCGISVLYFGSLIPASDPLLLFLFFMVFNISLLMFCYMMSSFFKTATIAALSGIVAYLASFLPFMVAITLENEMNFVHKVLTCFSMSTSFCFGMMYMTRFEVQGVGMQWSNLWHSPMQGDPMNVGTAMIMMLVDAGLYFLVAWYISHVSPPGNNARHYPWLFFLSLDYWRYDFTRSFGFGEEDLGSLESLGNDNVSLFSNHHNQDNLSIAMDHGVGDEDADDDEPTFNIIDPEEIKSINGKHSLDFLDTMISGDGTGLGTMKTISGTLRRAIHQSQQQQSTLTRQHSHDSSASTLSANVLGMELRGLYVIYNERSTRSKHIAVSNLNLNLKEGSVTTILGRNGAGKTTTISVLTGQMPPTSGSVTIYGHRIPEDFGRARRLLGYCPQYNTLFSNLTIREHLMFFAELKGLLTDEAAIQRDVDEILQNMGLWSLQHQRAKHLSGGLKRRLCVALAFVGGSKLIILDEPTSSVDPVARRSIWDLIVQQKRSRTVLLTTHHMDEAEILSDEVAVIHRGKLLCVGSPLLLKSKYGCGYQLTVTKRDASTGGVSNEASGTSSSSSSSSESDTQRLDDVENDVSLRLGEEEDLVVDEEELAINSLSTNSELASSTATAHSAPQSDVDRLMAFTRCLIPNASFVEGDCSSGEVILALPQYDDHGAPHDYATFFSCLDSNIRSYGFASYGVTSTTLEEVFLTLCSLEESNVPVEQAKLAVARRMSYTSTAVQPAKLAASTLRGMPANFPSPLPSSPPSSHPQSQQTKTETNYVSSEIELDSGLRLKGRQLYALLTKRFLHMLRDWKMLFCTLFLPCLFIAFAMAMTLIKPSFAPDPSLPLLPQIYGQNTVSFLANDVMRLPNIQDKSQLLKNAYNLDLLNQLRLIEGELVNSGQSNQSAIDCLTPRENWRASKCPIMYSSNTATANVQLPQHLLTLKGNVWTDRNTRRSCKCGECFLDMAAMAYLIPPPLTSPYGFIYNLSRGVDVNSFLLRTQPEFMDRRWGGWSLHQVNEKDDRRPLKMLRAPLSNRSQLISSMISAVKPARSVVKVWYDNTGFHSMPAYLSALNNALLRANLQAVGVADASQYQITTYSHPLHVRSLQLGDQSVMQQAGDAGIAIIILVGFIFIPTSFVFYIVRERMCEEKHLQWTFGVGPSLYWFSSLLWDLAVLVVAIFLASAIIAFFRLPIYMARLNLPAILSLLFFFGWAMINLVYLMEKLFTEPSIAFMVIYCLALFVGIHTMVMRLMIDVFKLVEVTPTLYRLFEQVAVILPPYLLLSGIVDVHRNQLFADIFSLFDQDVYVNPFSMELLGKHFSVFAIEGAVLFLLNLALECGLFSSVKALFFARSRRLKLLVALNSASENAAIEKSEDGDVADERRRVSRTFGQQSEQSEGRSSSSTSSNTSNSNSGRNGSPCSSDSNGSDLSATASNNSSSSDILRVFSVTKVFESIFGYKRAVNDVTFSVPRGECFGLLGTNGAGKSTLFKVLVGQVKATSGEASFNGRNIRDALASGGAGNSIGYCPQADSLDSFLSPVEHLRIYAHLRGIPQQSVEAMVAQSIVKFQLQPHAQMPVEALSRGNRRKLCLAIAMLGNPSLILLDEPTSGLDPQSRRYICQTIQDAIRDRRSILLTSHSMEECDILCSRLAIMVNGRFKCIGSPQYLKHKFGTGYIITLRLSEVKSNFKEVIEFVRDNFAQAILRAHHHTMLEFNLPTNDIPLSNIFAVLQRAQRSLSLQDYSVSQTTLDQVFVSFASQQVNDDEPSSYEVPKTKLNKKLAVSAAEKPSTNSGSARIAAGLSSTLTANIHETKVSLKRHASQLMSLCRERRKAKKRTSAAAANEAHHYNQQQQQPQHQPAELFAQQLQQPQPKVTSHQQQHLKNNILLSSSKTFQKPHVKQQNLGAPSITRVNSHVSSLAKMQPANMPSYLTADRFWTISGFGNSSGGQYHFQSPQQHHHHQQQQQQQQQHQKNLINSAKQRGVPVMQSGKVSKAKRQQPPPLTGGNHHQNAATRYSAVPKGFASTLPPNAGLYGGGSAGVSLRRASMAPPIGSSTIMIPEHYEQFGSRHHIPSGMQHIHAPNVPPQSSRFHHSQQHYQHQHLHPTQHLHHYQPAVSKSSTMPGHRLPPNTVRSQNSKHRASNKQNPHAE